MVKRGMVFVVLGVLCVTPCSADAAYPGHNGKISFTRKISGEIWAVNPDGSGETSLPAASRPRGFARWSPDGTRFATHRVDGCGMFGVCTYSLATYAANGTDERVVTGTPTIYGPPIPSPSPDGTELAYSDGQLRAINIDGSNDRLLTTECGGVRSPVWSPDGMKIAYETRSCDTNATRIAFFCFGSVFEECAGFLSSPEDQPSWSPDGRRIVFTRFTADGQQDIHVGTLAGRGLQRLTTDAAIEKSPAWSPDGTKIAFISSRDDPNSGTCSSTSCDYAVYVMNIDGGEQTRVSSIHTADIQGTDWQPLPVNTASGYARPKGATPVQVSLVPTFEPCLVPNRTHGPPLAFGSCHPPTRTSARLVVGATDDLPAPNESAGFLRMDVRRGVPGPPQDSDVRVTFSLTNVMYAADFADYPGELTASVGVRRTDQELGPVSSTSQDFPFRFKIQCTATADTSIGGTCATNTTVNALFPGAIRDGQRAIWAFDQINVYDGGNDGDVETPPQFPFVTQGIFVP
jgi:Tol biopolymer transport system component